ncbi:hypothetical protein HN681_02180 [archaeon]|jgi:hypothetical protein|nr:hypothetical protein [archaeon]MBT3731384.1 hypothetical protein [archaeon]MBT4670313.1 hypothetical protein [archaeon]MBT5029669.1 hypothetical protein [archaeon]MBT5287582.1 hypothetical protein [archaeon]
MRNQLLLLGLLSSGCSDYSLNRIDDDANGLEDVLDTGFQGEDNFEEYDPCDPYDEVWSRNPDGEERPSCYAIQSHLEEGYDDSQLCVLINYSECFEELGTIKAFKNESEIFDGFGYATIPRTCNDQKGYIEFCFHGENRENGEEESVANAYVDFDIWILSKEEEDVMEESGANINSEKEEYIKENHDGEQLYAIVECREDEHTTSDCSGIIY